MSLRNDEFDEADWYDLPSDDDEPEPVPNPERDTIIIPEVEVLEDWQVPPPAMSLHQQHVQHVLESVREPLLAIYRGEYPETPPTRWQRFQQFLKGE